MLAEAIPDKNNNDNSVTLNAKYRKGYVLRFTVFSTQSPPNDAESNHSADAIDLGDNMMNLWLYRVGVAGDMVGKTADGLRKLFAGIFRPV